MSHWSNDAEATLARAWELIDGSAAEPLLATLATIGLDGAPEARTLMLVGGDRGEGTVLIQADARSIKVDEITRDPRAQLLAWVPEAKIQLRLSGRAEVLTGAPVAERWDRMSAAGRINYGGTPPTGQPIPAPDAFTKQADPARFALIPVTLERIEVVYLSAEHRRAAFRRQDGWRATWLAP